jgi:hypothetical protein
MGRRGVHGALTTCTVMGCMLVAGVGGAAAQTLSPIIRATPSLVPAFNPSVTNYVTRCVTGTETSASVSVYVRARGNEVSIDSATPRIGIFDDSVTMSPGQGFTITVGPGPASTTYNVRCLPANFPTYSAKVLGARQAAYYLVAPGFNTVGKINTSGYVAMFDNNGVPVWWYSSTDGNPADADVDPNGDLSWAEVTGPEEPFGEAGTVDVEEHTLDGALVNTFNTVGEPADFHEAWPLANGDMIIDSYVPDLGVSIDVPGLSPTVNVVNGAFQVIAPDGSVVYSWNSIGNVNPADSINYSYFYDYYDRAAGVPLWDWDHINAVQPYEDGYIVSFRNTGAVYYIDGTTGAVIWKLGGTYDPGESLTIEGDPDSATDFDSQHDARVWPDGSISVFDNGTRLGQQPRELRFSIDAADGTATLIQSFTYPTAGLSLCCGSGRAIDPSNMATTNWVIAWGDTPYITEDTSTGTVVFSLDFKYPYFTYRAVPITSSQYSLSQLEGAMNTMYGTPAALATSRPRTTSG